MGNLKTRDDIYFDLKTSFEDLFGQSILRSVPLTLGLLNLKWKVETSEGTFVLKQFSKERYERFDLKKVAVEQEAALREQLRQYEFGTPCPRLLTHSGNVIHTSHNHERFVVMEFVPGENLLPGTLTSEQMYSLGRVTAQMHNICNDGRCEVSLTPKFLPPSPQERIEHWKGIAEQAHGNERVLALIVKQIRATEHFSLDLIRSCQPGWAHRDLWVDNMLFLGNNLSAILDFDRFAFDYPELDIARAIMSGALDGERLNIASAVAFLVGYRTRREFERRALVRALQLLWYLESVWWVVPWLERTRYQEVQFEKEMVWLAENFVHLPSIFGDV